MQAPDRTDLRILALLQDNARISNQDLAQRVALSPSACLRRVRALEEAGFIRSWRAVLDAPKLGFEIEALVQVWLSGSLGSGHERFLAEVAVHQEIIQASIVTGSSNYMLTVRTRDMAAYTRFLEHKLARMHGVREMRSHIVLRKIKDCGDMLPLAE